ncbi:hypothetical protein O6H91_Y084200 [Diphasiastrum complanatum]|nr:hypothetical protein O6H91_Y084200 [Diphasiastrum complanatum]
MHFHFKKVLLRLWYGFVSWCRFRRGTNLFFGGAIVQCIRSFFLDLDMAPSRCMWEPYSRTCSSPSVNAHNSSRWSSILIRDVLPTYCLLCLFENSPLCRPDSTTLFFFFIKSNSIQKYLLKLGSSHHLRAK